jgi:hypothetical protein
LHVEKGIGTDGIAAFLPPPLFDFTPLPFPIDTEIVSTPRRTIASPLSNPYSDAHDSIAQRIASLYRDVTLFTHVDEIIADDILRLRTLLFYYLSFFTFSPFQFFFTTTFFTFYLKSTFKKGGAKSPLENTG